MKKLAVIRGHKAGVNCPYGLEIVKACLDAGDAVSSMQALDTIDKKDIDGARKSNKVIYLTQKTGERCKFANEVMVKFDAVDCSYGDTAAGEHGGGYIPGSPLYPRTFVGTGFDSSNDNRQQYITDPRYFQYSTDQGVDVPFGLYSVFSDKSNYNQFLKIAARPTNKVADIEAKLALLRDRYLESLKLVVSSTIPAKLTDEQLEKLIPVIDDWSKT
jgi:hypothetical protein